MRKPPKVEFAICSPCYQCEVLPKVVLGSRSAFKRPPKHNCWSQSSCRQNECQSEALVIAIPVTLYGHFNTVRIAHKLSTISSTVKRCPMAKNAKAAGGGGAEGLNEIRNKSSLEAAIQPNDAIVPTTAQLARVHWQMIKLYRHNKLRNLFENFRRICPRACATLRSLAA